MGNRYRRIILHAGLHKTGTTSIQDNCYRQRELLLQEGIMYPSFKFRHKNIVNHSDCITADVCRHPGGYGAAFRQQVAADPFVLRQAIKPQMDELLREPQADTLVLSGEGVADYDDIDSQALLARLQAHTEELRVVAYIRSPQSSLESILQQRVKSGEIVDPSDLKSVVRQRYERLRDNFSAQLETFNFHDAIEHPGGIVGHFMALLGVSEDKLTGIDFKNANERITREAYKIMLALNRQYPVYPLKENSAHGVKRKPFDLHPLTSLPGQPFQIDAFIGSELYDATMKEGALLESELGFRFPEIAREVAEPMWQENTLLSLEMAIRSLKSPALQAAAAEFLFNEAREIEGSRPGTAAVLHHIGRSLQSIKRDEIRDVAGAIGADYFKFAALQIEEYNPKLAHQLMTLALELRPGAEFMQSKLQVYEAAIKKAAAPKE